MTDTRLFLASFRGSCRGLPRAGSALLAVLALTFAVSSVTRAQEAPPSPGVMHIKLRQATMTVIGSEFGPLIGVASGRPRSGRTARPSRPS
jgi:hypothetical protein